ncbi:MAG: RNA polymerase sigma factor [Bacteroidales bacterium]|nr:RNA polymerase sigma factor [Bacteroidales bacterium]
MKGIMDIIEENKDGIKSICHFYASMSSFLLEEDIFQEVAFNLIKSYRKYERQPGCNISTWVYRVAINVSISMMRKENRMSYIPIDETFVDNQVFDEEIRLEEVKELYETIKRLDAEEQTLVFLYLDSKSYKEIAEILGISVTNVGTKLQRVKMKLKKLSHEDTKK